MNNIEHKIELIKKEIKDAKRFANTYNLNKDERELLRKDIQSQIDTYTQQLYTYSSTLNNLSTKI